MLSDMIKNIIFDVKKNKKLFRKISKLLIIIFIFLCILIIASFCFNRNIKQSRENQLSHEEVTVDYNFEYKLYSDNESNSKIFSDAIVGAINSANESIELAIYSIDIKEIINLLILKKKEGLSVKIVLPEKRRKEVGGYFENSGVDLIFVGESSSEDNNSDLMHHKFLIIDSDTENRNIIFGALNFTDYQEKYDSSYIIQTYDKEIIKSFKNEFVLLAEGINSVKKLRNNSYKIFSKKINYENGYIELWFGPGLENFSVKQRMIELVSSAKQKINIIAWQFNDKLLFNSLTHMADAAINIKLISDDMFIWSNLSAIKRTHNMEVLSDAFGNFLIKGRMGLDNTIPTSFNPYIHYHFMIIDDSVLVTGTNNWGFAGFNLNDENILVTNISSLVHDFSKIFDFQYKKNRNTKLNFENIDINTIRINQEVPINSRIVFYIDDTRQKQKTYEVCYEQVIPDNHEITFPEYCNREHVLLFIVDDEDKLLSSDYLN